MTTTLTINPLPRFTLSIFTLLLVFIFNQTLLAQVVNNPSINAEANKAKKKKKAKLPPEDLTGEMLENAKYNFKHSALKNISSASQENFLTPVRLYP